MAKYADEALPCQALLFAEGGGDVRKNNQSVSDAVEAKGGAPDRPAPRARGGDRKSGRRVDSLVFDVEQRCKVEFGGCMAEGSAGMKVKGILGSFVEEAEAACGVEGEYGRLLTRSTRVMASRAAERCLLEGSGRGR